jgi:alkanesulfonate monooxygenase SsuD/methylene tetrahydromethanopterin reductase-like flavin-dependent oxidoreductase (luciferase family)
MHATARDVTRSGRVRIGLRYELHAAAAEATELYPALLAHAEQAEALGAEVLWISERPFAAEGRAPAALPLCAALAARTRRAHVGAGPLALPLYHPLRLAEDAASLDGVAAGRLELAVGLGADVEGYDGFGIPQRERVPRFEEALALLRQAFSAEPIEFEGRFHTLHGLAVWPPPVRPGGPPIWIAAGADTAARRAARLGDGLLCPPGPAAETAAAAFLAAWREAGRPLADARLALELALPAGDPGPGAALSATQTLVEAALAPFDPLVAVDLLIPATPGEPSGAAALAWLPSLLASVKSASGSADVRGGTEGKGG